MGPAMSTLTINAFLHRQRRRLLLFATLLALGGVVAGAHGAMAQDHMGDGMVMCTAVLEAAALAVVAAVLFGVPPAIRLPRWIVVEPDPCSDPTTLRRALGHPRARAGPSLLQTFRL